MTVPYSVLREGPFVGRVKGGGGNSGQTLDNGMMLTFSVSERVESESQLCYGYDVC